MSPPATYRQRHPEGSAFYQCLEAYWEEFKESYPYFYEKEQGPWRSVVEKSVERFLECGIFRHGFARIHCPSCEHEYLLAFSCKTRYFCPSCQAKRVAAFVEWVTDEVLEPVDHRQYVWTIPRVLRPAFRRDRRLLGDLARCAWKTLRQYFRAAVGRDSVPAAIVAIQTYGDALNFHPHLHTLVADGAWNRSGTVSRIPHVDSQILTRLFAHHVREMLISRRRLSRDFSNRLASWHHSGFHIYCSRPVDRDDKPALERLCAYILRPSFATSRLRFDEKRGQIEYQTKKGLSRSMDALDWIALVISHIPAEAFAGRRRANWARLLKKVYEVDPLICPRCAGPMCIIAFIEDPGVIGRILQHLGSWQQVERSPPPRLFARSKLETFLAALSPTQAQQLRTSTDSIFWDDVPVFED